MKRYLLLQFLILSIFPSLWAKTYNVDAGSSIRVYCESQAPRGQITHVFFEYYNNEDASYLGMAYSTSDGYATLYGLAAKSNIKLKVTYAYSYPVLYNNERYVYQVGHGSYDIYINVVGYQLPTEIKLSPERTKPTVGEVFRIKTNLKPTNTNCALNWGVAAGMPHRVEFIDWEEHDAIVRITRAGQYIITAEAPNGVFGACTIDVANNEPTSFSIPDDMTIDVGDPKTILPSFYPSKAYSPITWFYEPSSTLVMYGDTIIGLEEGIATIYGKTENGLTSNSCKVTVKCLEPEEISLSHDRLSLSINEQAMISAITMPEIVQTSFVWKSSNSKVATVSELGEIKGISAGQTDITVTTGNGLSATCRVTVIPNPESIEFDYSSVELNVGTKTSLITTIYPADAQKSVTWSSSDESVALVTNKGEIYGMGQGICNVIAVTSNGKKAVCEVKVYSPDSYLVVWQVNGEKARFHLNSSPQIEFLDSKFFVKSQESEIIYAEKDVRKFTIEKNKDDSALGIDNVYNDHYRFNSAFNGTSSNSSICIFDLNGKLLQSLKADSNGFVNYSLDSYPSGIYIIKSGTTSFKIIKK